MARSTVVRDAWADLLEQRARALPGVKLVSVNPHGSKIYKAGSYRFVIPRADDRDVRRSVEAEFATFERRVRHGHAHEFGTRPSDVDLMRPLGPLEAPGSVEPPATTNHHEAAPIEDAPPSAAQELAPMEAQTEDPATVNPATVLAEEEPTVAKKTGRRFGPCPVDGCDGTAQGRHIRLHKQRGELPADWSAAAAKRAAKTSTNGTRRASRKAALAARRESASTRPKGAMGAAVRSYVNAIYAGLTALSEGPIAELAQFADTCHGELAEVRREMAQLRERFDRAAQAFHMTAGDRKSVVAKLRS